MTFSMKESVLQEMKVMGELGIHDTIAAIKAVNEGLFDSLLEESGTSTMRMSEVADMIIELTEMKDDVF